MVDYVYYGWNLRYENETNTRFGTVEVMDDLDISVRSVSEQCQRSSHGQILSGTG